MNEKLIAEVEKLSQTLEAYEFGKHPSELYEPIRYILNIGGKRIRPLLTLLAYSLYKDDTSKAVLPSLSVEVFHNFTLMHDDIMDNAPLRRGQTTVHEKWNPNLAILSGDVMLVKAYEMLASVEDQYLRSSLFLFNKVATEVCEGQQLDMNFEKRDNVSIEEYIEMIRLKTAVLLGFSLKLGGLLAGASEQDQERLRLIGESIGIGFQLKDDLLDVYGDQAKFGKQVGGDILANKKTFLLLTALANASKIQSDDIYSLLKGADPQKVEKMTSLYDNLNVRNITEAKIFTYFRGGFDLLNQLEVSESKKYQLEEFFTWLTNRDN